MHSLQMHSTLTVVAIIIALSTTQSTSVSLGEIDNIFTRLGTHEGEIQLHIQWNDTVQEDWNFDVSVTTMSNFSECSQTLCYQYDIPKATKAIVLPNVIMSYAENGECVIQPGCSYNIKIASTNGKVSKTKHIDIPYCVDDVCSCQHASDLPKVKMQSSLLLNNTVDISWTISMEGKNSSQLYKELQLEKIYVSIGQQRKPSLTWGGQLRLMEERIYSIKENSNPMKTDAIEGRASFQTTEPLYREHWYQIRSHLIDKRNCTGPMEHFAIQLPQSTSSLRRNEISVTMQIAIIIISSVTLCCVTIFAMICMRRRNQRQAKNIPTVLFTHYGKPFSPDAMEDNILYVDKDIEEAQVKGLADVFEVPCTSLCIGPEIGVGAFGRVFKATAKNLMRMRGTTIVAVKQLKANPSSEEIQEFLTEINMLKGVGRHHNIVSFLGCCTIRPPYMMIMEFVGRGDLLGYLRTVRSRVSNKTSLNQKYSENHVSKTPAKDIENQQRAVKYIELKLTTNSEVSLESEVGNHPKPSVTETMYTTLSESPYSMDEQEEFTFDYILDHKELHNFALQIANGMQFLEEQQITHRDLAARNVLIDDTKTLKISDFGLSRHGIYTNTKTRKLPLRWLSIEAIRDNLYSSKSDVWAFGVVLWEIGTLGASPYPTLSSNELIPFLLSGQRLEKPEICTDQVYELMLDCWHEDPLQRPSFADAYQKLQPKTVYVDISSLSDDYVFPPIQEKN